MILQEAANTQKTARAYKSSLSADGANPNSEPEPKTLILTLTLTLTLGNTDISKKVSREDYELALECAKEFVVQPTINDYVEWSPKIARSKLPSISVLSKS